MSNPEFSDKNLDNLVNTEDIVKATKEAILQAAWKSILNDTQQGESPMFIEPVTESDLSDQKEGAVTENVTPEHAPIPPVATPKTETSTLSTYPVFSNVSLPSAAGKSVPSTTAHETAVATEPIVVVSAPTENSEVRGAEYAALEVSSESEADSAITEKADRVKASIKVLSAAVLSKLEDARPVLSSAKETTLTQLKGTTKKQRAVAAAAGAGLLVGGVLVNKAAGGDSEGDQGISVSGGVTAELDNGWFKDELCVEDMAMVRTSGSANLQVLGKDHNGKSKWIDDDMQKLNLDDGSMSIDGCVTSDSVEVSDSGSTRTITVDMEKLELSTGDLNGVARTSRTYDVKKLESDISAQRKALLDKHGDDPEMANKIKEAEFTIDVDDDSKFKISALKEYNKTVDSEKFESEYDGLLSSAVLARIDENNHDELEKSVVNSIQSRAEADAKKDGIKNVEVDVNGDLQRLSVAAKDDKTSAKDPLSKTLETAADLREDKVRIDAKDVSQSVESSSDSKDSDAKARSK